MIIRITGIDLLTKEEEGDPDYLVYVEVGRVLDTGGEQILAFTLEATESDLKGSYRKSIEQKVRDQLRNGERTYHLIGDTWVTDDHNGEIEFIPDTPRKTMAA